MRFIAKTLTFHPSSIHVKYALNITRVMYNKVSTIENYTFDSRGDNLLVTHSKLLQCVFLVGLGERVCPKEDEM